MAGDWIKIRTSLLDDPDVMRLSDILQLEDATTVGLLVRFWAWADKQTPDGKDIAITSARLDRLIGHSGFADAMRQVGWLSGRDGSLSLPRFERHNGNSAKARALEAEAKRLRRQMSDNSDENVGQVSDALSDQRREEKSRTNTKDRERASGPELDVIDRIVTAYPLRDSPMECHQAVSLCLSAGEDPERMLAAVQACAVQIRLAPGGHGNRFVPTARNFFQREEWRSPEKFQKLSQPKDAHKPPTPPTAGTSGANKPGRYS